MLLAVHWASYKRSWILLDGRVALQKGKSWLHVMGTRRVSIYKLTILALRMVPVIVILQVSRLYLPQGSRISASA